MVLSRPRRRLILNALSGFFQSFPPRKLEGPVPWTREWPLGIEPCSPNGRPSRIDSKGSSPALPMGVCEGHIRGARCASTGIPARGRIPAPRTDARRWHPDKQRHPGIPFHRIPVAGGPRTHGSPTDRRCRLDPGRYPRNLFPFRLLRDGAVDALLIPFTTRLERTTSCGCFPMTAA